VALELVRAMEAIGQCELFVLSTSQGKMLEGIDNERVSYLPGCARVPGLMTLGGPLVAMAARRLRLDVVHDPVGISPFTLGRWAGAYRRVLTIHDAIAFRHPEGYSWSNNFLHRRFVPATLRNVDGAITVSQHARADLEKYLGLPPEFVSVVTNGVGDSFKPLDPVVARQVAKTYGLNRPYILNVGGAQPRKNVDRLLRAYKNLQTSFPDLDLVLVGAGVSRNELLRRAIAGVRLTDRVLMPGAVAEPDLPAIYSAASLFAFPSLFEGFGLPVLEAMACGTPVVCSSATSLPEVAGDAALLVDPLDVDAIASAMDRVLSDQSLASRLRSRGVDRAAEFTWARTARETLDAYRRFGSNS
jgi:glycosyltransferase involved in cell wall biosynthesis